MLDSRPDVVRCLLTYADWWQPTTGSVLVAALSRRASEWDGLRAGLIDSIDERSELCRRMAHIDEADRHILLLWYIAQLAPDEIAHVVGISRRQCYRRRAQAIQMIVSLGKPEEAA